MCFPLVGLRFDVALCYRGLSPCVLIDFPGLGAVGSVCGGGRLCLDVAFTSSGGECLHTTKPSVILRKDCQLGLGTVLISA